MTNAPYSDRVTTVTTVARYGSTLHGIVNSDWWDQSRISPSISGYSQGPVTRFQGQRLLIPTPRGM